ncbi:putative metal-dependent hydrolase of the TIM-barrel fold protein [Terricaulis silvestris]|uniref:Putative metal-dependent hydrolase of the TIM-barrel fold protein n=2 Tax=Terricaulis silvestris TaxID=2686094 RepID=A0A6I6MRC9_9CAUL|nr:putative metal-dependent hydrolase of the TIM-barrel fold protein [Terricaulis silvestris]
MQELDAWQSGAAEPVLEPDLPIVDAHHHLWHRPLQHYGAPELGADLGAGHNVLDTVFVECMAGYRPDGPEHLKPVGETEFVVAETAGASGMCGAILGHADLTQGSRVRETLEAHITAGAGRFRGVRHQAQYDAELGSMSRRSPPPHGLLDVMFREGVEQLTALGLVLDVYLYFTQLSELAAFARAAPDTTLILNHTGTPLGVGPYANNRAEVFAHWAQGIEDLSACPNVLVKLGGLGMTQCGFGFETHATPPASHELAEVWRPYIETAIAAFGPQRAMFESNFPVDKQSCSYRALWNAFKIITRNYSSDERRDLFCKAAARAYRLNL